MVGPRLARVIDPKPLWNFADPAASEARFRASLVGAEGPDRDVLATQVARALGLQERYGEALELLGTIDSARPEVRARVLLERGRVLRSSGDDEAARPVFDAAVAAADEAGLEGLAVDAMHMVALTLAGADQLAATQVALERSRRSVDPDARAWAASLLNNLGMAYSEVGDWPGALAAFEEALIERRLGTDDDAVRVARWMVAWALRNLGRLDEALAQQRALKADLDAAGLTDPYVDEELAILEGE